MTKGVVLIAKNPGTIDYVKIALWQARRIRRFLDLPTTIITDKPFTSSEVNVIATDTVASTSMRKFYDAGKTQWLNSARWEAYALSPYDETLLLDADYVVSSDILLSLFGCSQDLLAHKDAYDVSGTDDFAGLNNFSALSMPMWWATVVYFKKTQWARAVFDMMEMVEKNYTHYAELYKFTPCPYRNDYALSIALTTLSGHTPSAVTDIPWTLATTTPTTAVYQVSDTTFDIRYEVKEKAMRQTVRNMDLHVMAKTYLEAMADD